MQKTVFVVGAGASTEFGETPIGDQLARNIEGQLIREFDSGSRWPDGPIANAIASMGGLGDAQLRAMSRIRDSVLSCPSIDQFVYEWQEVPHLPEIAKLCIAYFMLEAERKTTMARIQEGSAVPILRVLEQSWLAVALSHLNPSARRRDILDVLEGVSFVTFNYDRCIEKYLRESFFSTYGMNRESAEQAAASIPILHVYGCLGPLPAGAAAGIEYGGPDFLIKQAAGSIKTYMEEVDSNHAMRIQAVLREADRIIFLGCAFHEQNMALLFPAGSGLLNAQAWGTTFKMRSPQIERARGRLPFRSVLLESVECRELLERNREPIFDD